MLNVLMDLAENLSSVREFRKDPHAFLDAYPDLTGKEREMLLEGDSRKVGSYVSGKVNAETTIVVILIAPAANNYATTSVSPDGHRNFWDHVSERSNVLAA